MNDDDLPDAQELLTDLPAQNYTLEQMMTDMNMGGDGMVHSSIQVHPKLMVKGQLEELC